MIVERAAMLGPDGGGLDLAMVTALPWFLVLNAAFSLGLSEEVTAESTAHLTRHRLEHLDQTLAQQVTPRLDLARMRIETDRTRAFLADTVAALDRAGTTPRCGSWRSRPWPPRPPSPSPTWP